MLSSLDSILDIPLDYALDQLPLTPEIPNAILKKEGFAGELQDYVLNYEQWPPISNSFSKLESEIINNVYIESIDWTKNLLSNVTWGRSMGEDKILLGARIQYLIKPSYVRGTGLFLFSIPSVKAALLL